MKTPVSYSELVRENQTCGQHGLSMLPVGETRFTLLAHGILRLQRRCLLPPDSDSLTPPETGPKCLDVPAELRLSVSVG